MAKKAKFRKNKKMTPMFFVALFNFLIIILLVTYIIYLRFIPYTTLEYDGYAVSGKDIANNLLNTNFDVDHSVKALQVKDQDSIYENLSSYYLGASKQDNINLNYPIFVNNSLALYNLSSDVTLITDDFQEIPGYAGITLTSGALYNTSTMQRADYYDYILMKNTDNLYINTKEIKIKTNLNEYTIAMNSIINFTSSFITYYSLNNDEFVYNKILDVDENSTVSIPDYNKQYTYKEFLLGLKIIQETTPAVQEEPEEEQEEENETHTNHTVKEEVVEEPTQEEQPVEQPTEIIEENNSSNTPVESKWVKPTVTCDNFVANVYSAYTQISITDPSRVIYKAVTFTFYKDDQIAFRTSSTSSGTLSVTKLLPSTTYKIVGTYQYRNKEGSLIENTILEQEITTKGVENLNPINLSFENGQVYSSKIELKDLHIVSNIEDEAIYGVSKAEIIINGTKYSIDSSTLRSLLRGDTVTYQSSDGLRSNTKCDYEIRFYDTAGNTMNLTNHTGSTVTSKKAPSVKIKVSAQEVISVTIEPTLVNDDQVELKNYRYTLYSSTGEVVANAGIGTNEKTLVFNKLDPQNTYTIKVYADFDIEDGKGLQYDQEIGNATFTTLALSKLGSLKLNITYDDTTDITYHSINLTTSINTSKTDSRLIQILKSVHLSIQNEEGSTIQEVEMTDINSLSTEEGIKNLIENLNSNTTYNIVMKAIAEQGNTQEEITTSYTLTKFITNKLPAELNIANVIVTTSLIDMDIYIDDIDGTCIENIVTIRMTDSYGKEYLPTIEPSEIESNTLIPTNQWVRLTYTGLNENETYTLTAEVSSYNETNDSSKIQNNFQIDTTQFVTTGLGGTIDLLGLERQKMEEGANLIDVKSENNWYAQCFDAMTSSYSLDESYNAIFTIDSKYNYGKNYTESGNTITLQFLSNQCYVYDFSNYIGQTVTISFSAKITDTNGKVYLQKGKEIGQNIEEITNLKTNDYITYQKTLTVPSDGYLGFYLEKYEKEEELTEEEEQNGEEPEMIEIDYYLEVKDLKVELGDIATAYTPYQYQLLANVNVNFIDENHATFDKEEQRCRYFVRLTSGTGMNEEFDYTYDSYENVENTYQYQIPETEDETEYTLDLIIKQNGREYVLDSATFTYSKETTKEIKSITTAEEFLEIQPYGNYIILNDIDLTGATTAGEFTFGSPNIAFYGSIDFNGNTIKKDTYSLATRKETTSYLFYELEETASLKNIVIDYNINNTTNRYTIRVEGTDQFIDPEDGIYSLFLYNHATIDNMIVNLKGCTEKQRIHVGLIGYQNEGTIQNFVVNFENTLYGSQYLAGVCLYSSGTIQNGYLYGLGIEGIEEITIGDYRYIAGVVFQVDGAGVLQNVYNISPVYMNHCDSTYSYGANIVYNVGYPPVIDEITGAIISTKDSTAIVRNVYSVTPLTTIYNGYEYYSVLDATNKESNIGPNILNKYTSTQVYESYYFCDVNYEASDYNTRSSGTALYEAGVQNLLLNANGFNQFIIDMYVNNGYYPQLKLNYCMPEQENLRIDLTGTEIIDVLSATVIENNDIYALGLSERVQSEIESYIRVNNIDLTDENQKLAEFRIYNPAGTTISEINLNYLQATILSQSYSKKVSTVYVLLNNPTSFLDVYNVASIRSRMANGRIMESIYGENEDLGTRSIEVTFIKNISTAEEWNNINNPDANGVSGLIQNYRLIADIDFASADYAPYITGTFEGFLDGKYNGKIHTLKNIEGTQSLIKSFGQGTIQNLYIDNFIINTSSQNVGFIETANITDNIKIDNIHINEMEINSTYSGGSSHIGGIIGYLDSSSSSLSDNITIQNCSIQGFTVEFTNTSITGICVGGILGYIHAYGGVETYINNCYVQNITMNADVTSNSGVGGIIGYKTHNVNERIKAGQPYFYIRNCFTTGKINTKMHAGGILGYGQYGNTYIQYCYSLTNFNSKVTSGTAYIGGIAGYSGTSANCITNNLYLGNIYVAGNSVGGVNRIFGANAGTASYNNYAYKDQLINGEVLTSTLGATKLLSYEEIFQMNTYSNLLKFDNNYAYTIINSDGEEFNLIENEYLPELNDTEGNVLPNQRMNALDNDLQLNTITSTPSADKTQVTVVMKFENPNNLNLTRVKIENDDMQVVEGSWQTSVEEGTGLTVVTFIATPNKAFDSYKIEYIYYERNGQEVEKEISTKIKVELYKGISNAAEWNEFFAGEGRTYEGQNVKILGNIDFSTVDKIESNVTIGRLEADNNFVISNVNLSGLSSSSGFIKEIKTSLKNIHFKDSNLQGNGSYVGLIGILRGATTDCSFTNIKINCTGNYDYIGVISRCIAGSFRNITISHVTVTGRHYVGGLVGQTTSLGSSSNIEGTYLSITATGNYIGGIIGYSAGVITNISAYQYAKEGKQSGDAETSWLVKGASYVGGTIGYYVGGENTVNTVENTNSIIQGISYVGANFGCASGNVTNAVSTNNTIIGTGSYTGGNIGYQGGYTDSNITSTNNTITGASATGGNLGGAGWTNNNNLKATNNTIKGTTYVGGCIGLDNSVYAISTNLRSDGSNQTITGTSYVGGVTGRGAGRLRNAASENVTVTGTGNYVGGIIGSEEYATTSISSTDSTNYSLVGANAKNVTIRGYLNYVGGIAGYEIGTLAGGVVEQSTIVADGNYAGGIVGFYSGYTGTAASSISSSNFFLWHSTCLDSTVQAANYAGGIAGQFVYGNIQYCYVGNTSVTVGTNGAGGIVGYFDNSRLSNLQYKATIKYNFVANTQNDKTIYARNSAGGLIGIIAKQLNYDEEVFSYNNVECNLIVTDISSTGSYADMAIGSMNNSVSGVTQSPYMNNIYVYNCSYLNGIQVGGITEEIQAYNLVSSGELSDISIFTKNDRVLDEEGETIGNIGLNFGNARYDYTSDYFPTLKTNYTANLYWGSSYLNIVQTKIPIPTRTEEFQNTNTMSLSNANLRVANLMVDEELPELTVYAVDVDKINIEFSKVSSNTTFKVIAGNDIIVEKTPIEDRVYTLQYDFNTPLEITVSNLEYWYTQEVTTDNSQNLLSKLGDEYLYIADDTIHSNKRTINGEFVNLYENKALDKNGNIYDLTSMSILNDGNLEIKRLDEQVPMMSATYNNVTIQTFAHASKVIENEENYTYKDQQILVKNNTMYVIDGKLDTKPQSIIIDSYNNKQYEAVLGTDGVIYDLLTEINYPSNFKNEDIIAMTNNLNSEDNILLVYYASGKVYGFNYITGEEVYDNGVENVNFVDYLVSNLSLARISYNIDQADYVVAQELASKLEKVSIDEAMEEISQEQQNIEINITTDGENSQQSGQNTNQDVAQPTPETENDAQNASQMIQENTTNAATQNEYITTYDPGTQSYVVYSTAELLKMNSPKTQTENDKISSDSDLISYYSNLSASVTGVRDLGVVIISLIVGSICIILFILYKKNR